MTRRTRPALALVALAMLSGCGRDTAPATTPEPVPLPATPGADLPEPPPRPRLEWRLPGPLGPEATLESLRGRFGKEHVQVAEVPLGEGDSEQGVILFPEQAEQRAYLYFEDPQALVGLAGVRVLDPQSRWQLEPGIRIGLPATDLVALNGAPVSYSGFGWDYGGTVIDWHEGKLAGDEGRRWSVALDIPPVTGEAEGALDLPLGEGTFRSDDARYRKAFARAVVSEIGVRWLPAEDAEAPADREREPGRGTAPAR